MYVSSTSINTKQFYRKINEQNIGLRQSEIDRLIDEIDINDEFLDSESDDSASETSSIEEDLPI